MKRPLGDIAGRLAFALHREIVKRVPRRFKNVISVQQQNNVWVVGTNDEIFQFWEEGTRPHIIRPKNKQSLKFKWANAPAGIPNIDGEYFFKKVRHPGTKGHFLFKEIVEDENLMNDLLKQAFS